MAEGNKIIILVSSFLFTLSFILIIAVSLMSGNGRMDGKVDEDENHHFHDHM